MRSRRNRYVSLAGRPVAFVADYEQTSVFELYVKLAIFDAFRGWGRLCVTRQSILHTQRGVGSIFIQ